MTPITIRGLWTRKLRAGLTALAVLLGVMMISGTYVFTDTINHSFDRIFETANKGVDIKVVPHKTIDAEHAQVPPFSESQLKKVRSARGVAKADGGVNDIASVFDRNGKRLNKGGAPALMFSASPAPFNPLTYSSGHAPANTNEVVLDKNTADKHDFKLGDTVLVGGKRPAKRYRISGLAKFGDVSEFGGATIAVFTLPEAQRISQKKGELDEIDVAVAQGASTREVTAELRGLLPRTLDVKTGAQDAKDQAQDIEDSLGFLNTLLLVFAGIALFVGAFIIFNTFSITVAQRMREFAMLRTLGASRRQVMRSVVGGPLERSRGAPAQLARGNSVRTPSRTAATAAALMIGVALVAFVSILAA